MIFFKKIKGSALQFALLVSGILILLLASFLTLTYTYSFFNSQSEFIATSIDKANFSFNTNLDFHNGISNDSILINHKLGNTIINKTYWGGFEKNTSKATTKYKSFTKIALRGSLPPKNNTALYISQNNMPLTLVGDSKIIGDAYVSSLGIVPGRISRNQFNGVKLIEGSIYNSNKNLPPLDPNWKKYIENILSGNLITLNKTQIQNSKTITNSFFNETDYIVSTEKIVLDQTYIGNLIVKSNSEIIVTPESNIKDAIIIAPKITIQEGFTGNGNFIASKEILVKENVTLTYPSSIVCLNKTSINNEKIAPPSVILLKDVRFQGIIIYLEDNLKKTEQVVVNNMSNVFIDKNGIVEGNIYCQGQLELYGTIEGQVYTEGFLVNAFGTVYRNYLYNASILGNEINSNFCGLPFQQSEKGISKWLY